MTFPSRFGAVLVVVLGFGTSGALEPTTVGGVAPRSDMRATAVTAGRHCFIKWSTLLGGAGDLDRARVAVAPDGDLVVVMATTDPSWLAGLTPTVHLFGTRGLADVVVLRLSGDGDLVRWAAVLGGQGGDDGPATNGSLAVLPDNTIAICGAASQGFPLVNAYDTTLPSTIRYKGFILRMSADGASLLFSTLFGGNASESEFYSLAVDPAGRIVGCGRTNASDFPATPGAFQASPGGNRDAFVAAFTFDGTLLHATRFGGSGNEEFLSIALDLQGHAVVVGGYSSTPQLVGSPGDYDTTLEGTSDGALATFSDNLSTLSHFTYIGGGGVGGENIYALALDSDGGVVAILNTASTDLPIVPTGWSYQQGMGDPYVFKLASDWTNIAWGTYSGGLANDRAYALAHLPGGDWAIAGESDNLLIESTWGAFGPTYGAFVERLSPAETKIKAIFSPSGNIGYGLAVQANGRLVFAGDVTTAVGFPFVSSSLQTAYAGGSVDGFLLALDPDYTCLVPVDVPPGSAAELNSKLAVRVTRSDRVARQSTLAINQRAPGAVAVRVFDTTGRSLCSRVLPFSSPGSRTVELAWDDVGPGRLTAGVYFAEARMGEVRATTRIVVIR